MSGSSSRIAANAGLPWLYAGAGYVLLGPLFFWQPILDPEYSIPRGGGDMASMYFPFFTYAADSLSAGQFPWWNPYINAGAPFAADVQTAVYYSLNWIAFALADPFTYEHVEWLAMVHFPLAGFFNFLLGRRLGLGGWAAFGTGVAYAFSGAMVARLGHQPALAAQSSLPLLTLFLLQALALGRLRWAVAGGLIFALLMFAGHTQIALFAVLLLGLLWLWWLTLRPWIETRRWRRPRWAEILSFPVIIVVGVLTAAVQILPTAELLSLSVRSDISFNAATEFAVSPFSLVHLLTPHFFGFEPTNYWALEGSLTEGYGYIGISTLVVAVVGIVASWRRNHLVLFFGLLALLGLILALGQESAVYGWLYRFVPGFDKVRVPGRLLIFFDLGAAILAGYGLAQLGQLLRMRDRIRVDRLLWSLLALVGIATAVTLPALYFSLLTSQGSDPVIFDRVRTALDSFVVASIFAAAAVAVVYSWRRYPRFRPALPLLAIALLTVDLMSAGIRFNPGKGDVLAGYQHSEVVKFLRKQPGEFRIDAFTDVGGVWAPNLPFIERIDAATGSPINPLLLRRYDDYFANLGSRSVPGYDLMNVRYVVGSKDVELDWSKFEPALTDAPIVSLHRNRRELPRAFVVAEARVASVEEILATLRDPDWDPTREVLIELEPDIRPTAGTGQVTSIQHPSINETVVRGRSSGGWLVLNEVNYPGWQAERSGATIPIYQGNYLFKAIPLDPGPFDVRLRFSPPLWWLGLTISGVTLIVALVGLLGVRFFGRRQTQ